MIDEAVQEVPVETEPQVSILDDDLFMDRFRENLAQFSLPAETRPIPTKDISECGCTRNEVWGYVVLQTQEDGKILTPPREVLVTQDLFARNNMLEDINKRSGDFAIPDPIYTCGHSHGEFVEFWYN